jgi:hypothetical protein
MKIAIVGTAPSSRMLAPYDDKDWQIWALGAANRGALPRIDTWFEMHPLDFFEQEKMFEYLAWMSTLPKVFLLKESEDHPNAERFPIEPAAAEFGDFFFSSSVAYVMAMAIMQKPEAIGLYGIDMATDDEYLQQKTGCHFFIDTAQKRGIEVVVPPESDLLLTGGRYGYRQESPMYRKLWARRTELEKRIAQATATINNTSRELHTMQGAFQDVDYMLRTWVP